MNTRKAVYAVGVVLLTGTGVSCGGRIEAGGGDDLAAEDPLVDEDVDHVAEALLLGSTFEPWRTPPAWVTPSPQTCTEYYTSPGTLNADGLAIQAILNDVVKRGRMAAYSFAMADCLGDVMVTGNISFPHAPGATWGPYCRPTVDAGCSSGTATAYGWSPDSDPYNPNGFSLLTLADTRAVQARRVHTLAATNSRLRLACHKPNVTNGPETQAVIHDLTEEVISLRQDEYANLLVNGGSGAPAATRVNQRSYFAALVWHEAFHGHGYDHAVDGSATVRRQVPHVVGACLWQTMLDSNETVRAPEAQFDCIGTTCTGGALPVITTYPGGACTCIADPGVFTTARVATNRGSPGPIVLDAAGVMYRINGVSLQYFVFGTWVDLFSGGPEQIYAGGNSVFYRKSGSLFRLDGFTWTNLGSAGDQVVVDSLGQAYRRTAGTVARVRPGSTTWTNLIGLTSFTATKIFAGGDKVYATTTNGDVHEWAVFDGHPPFAVWLKVGNPGADFAVDSYGVLYGLAPDHSFVAAFRNDVWSIVGGPATGIVAGNRLYARNSSNQVFELYPDGSWQFVADAFSAWAAGGPRVVVKRSGNWFDYIHDGTNTIF